jgi:hypothetical protein
LAIAPTGLLSSFAPDPAVALDAVEAFAALVAFAGLGVDAAAAAGAAIAAVAAAPLLTPPWPEHAPRPPFDIDPSLHVTIAEPAVAALAGAGAVMAEAAAGALLAFGAFAALAAFATPPWPEHAPRPEVALVVPSLHVVAVACALAAPALSADAIAIAAAIAKEREMSRIAILHERNWYSWQEIAAIRTGSQRTNWP